MKPLIKPILIAAFCLTSAFAYAETRKEDGKTYFRLSCAIIDLAGWKDQTVEVSSNKSVQSSYTLTLNQTASDDSWELNALNYEYQCQGKQFYGSVSLGSAAKYANAK